MTAGGKPYPASCHALVLFGLLLTVTSLDRVWRTYSDTEATGWDALGGWDALVVVVFVVAVALVIWDAILPRERDPLAARIPAFVMGVALLVCFFVVAAAVMNESPEVFDGGQADDHPLGPAYAGLGGVLVMLVGWGGLIALALRDTPEPTGIRAGKE